MTKFRITFLFLIIMLLASICLSSCNQLYPDTADEVWGDLERHEGGRVWDTLTNEQQDLVHYPKFDNECVYWVPKGNSYHAIDWCYTLTQSSNDIRSGTLDEAILAGKTDPCSKCVGHR